MARRPRQSGVTGSREVVAALRELAQGIDVAAVDRAAVNALEPMLDATVEKMRANRNYPGKYPGFPDPSTPRKGGFLDRGIVIKKDGGSKKKRSYRIGARGRARYLIHLLEFGTAPHFQPNFKGGFAHPGAAPRPAMVPSFEEHKDDVPARFGRAIWLSLSAKAAQMNKKSKRRR